MTATTASIRVDWQKRISGGYSALAAEDKAGYTKGDIVTVIGYQPRRFPAELCVFVKDTNHAI